MMSESKPPSFDSESLAERIRKSLFRRGWNLGVLARRAGVSRTTLYYLQRGVTRRPRLSTLSKIARALGIAPGELCDDSLRAEEGPATTSASTEADDLLQKDVRRQRAFDRRTNPVISEIYRESPDLFTSWRPEEWDELYSMFGTGGQLSSQGVVEAVNRINRKRETIQQLHVVLETHLGEVAAKLIETLYQMVRPENNLAET